MLLGVGVLFPFGYILKTEDTDDSQELIHHLGHVNIQKVEDANRLGGIQEDRYQLEVGEKGYQSQILLLDVI